MKKVKDFANFMGFILFSIAGLFLSAFRFAVNFIKDKFTPDVGKQKGLNVIVEKARSISANVTRWMNSWLSGLQHSPTA